MAQEIKACRNKQANTAPSWKCMQMKMNTLSDQREEGAGAEGFYRWSSEAHTDCKKHIWVLIRLCLGADEQPSFAAKLSFSSLTIIWFMLLLFFMLLCILSQHKVPELGHWYLFFGAAGLLFLVWKHPTSHPPPPPLFKTVAGRGKSLQVWIWKVSVLTAEVMRLDHEGVSCWVVFWLMGVINHNSNKVCLEYWQEIAELLRQKLKTAHYSVFEYC